MKVLVVGFIDVRSVCIPGIVARPPTTGMLSLFMSDLIREMPVGRSSPTRRRCASALFLYPVQRAIAVERAELQHHHAVRADDIQRHR
jgi:hypothetical protein